MKVLFATDGRAPALAAQELLEKIGDRSTIDISVLSVTTLDVVVPERPLVFVDPSDARRRGAGKLVDRTVGQLRTAGFRAQGFTAAGTPSDQILEFIEDEGIDLAIVGAGHRSWVGNVALGSTSSYVLHHSPSAVLVVHSRPSKRSVAKALVALDGSTEAQEGLEVLAELADPQRCMVEVFSVAQPPQAPPYPMMIPYPTVVKGSPEVEKRKEERAEQIARRGAAELQREGFEAEAGYLVGDPAGTLIEVGRNGGFDLVVVGSRGLGPVRRALFGSVSEPVVRKTLAALVARAAKSPLWPARLGPCRTPALPRRAKQGRFHSATGMWTVIEGPIACGSQAVRHMSCSQEMVILHSLPPTPAGSWPRRYTGILLRVAAQPERAAS